MEETPTIEGIRACVIDAYGTLFDFASAAAACEDELGEQVKPLTALWRDKQVQYTWLRALQQRHADFWQVTGDALDYALDTLDLASPRLRERLMNLYLSLDTCQLARSPSSHQTPGTRMPPPRSGCVSCGATDMANVPNGFRAARMPSSARSRSCRHSSTDWPPRRDGTVISREPSEIAYIGHERGISR